MSFHVCATGHIKDPVPLIEKSRESCPSGHFERDLYSAKNLIMGRLYKDRKRLTQCYII